jgi:F-type H+-transporting ATPase subunit alpha
LNRGVRLYELLKQGQYTPMEMEEIVVTLFVGVKGFADKVDVAKVSAFAKGWLSFIKTSHKAAVIDAMVKENYTITKEIEATMLKLADEYTTSFNG